MSDGASQNFFKSLLQLYVEVKKKHKSEEKTSQWKTFEKLNSQDTSLVGNKKGNKHVTLIHRLLSLCVYVCLSLFFILGFLVMMSKDK